MGANKNRGLPSNGKFNLMTDICDKRERILILVVATAQGMRSFLACLTIIVFL